MERRFDDSVFRVGKIYASNGATTDSHPNDAFFTACGGGTKTSDAPVGNPNIGTVSNASNNQPTKKPGLSNAQKVGITLVGAAALYYLYRQHQNKKGAGKEGQYYQSKNGGIYYRDEKGRPVYVKPPGQPIQVQVPQSEAQQYGQYQGYNGRNTGRSFGAAGSQ